MKCSLELCVARVTLRTRVTEEAWDVGDDGFTEPVPGFTVGWISSQRGQ